MVRPVHGRMPVIMPPEHFAAWLTAGTREGAELLRPYPGDDVLSDFRCRETDLFFLPGGPAA